MKENTEIGLGANIINGKITYKGVADAFNLKYTPIDNLIWIEKNIEILYILRKRGANERKHWFRWNHKHYINKE